MLAHMANQRINITTKPPNMEFRPKKTSDQATLRPNCTAKIRIAYLTSLRSNPSLHTKKRAIPIKTYNIVQTGPNSQLGGFQAGFAREAYQVVSSVEVATDPRAAPKNTIKIDAISFGISLMLKLSIFLSS